MYMTTSVRNYFQFCLLNYMVCYSMDASSCLSQQVSGHSMLLLECLRTLEDNFHWSVSWLLVRNHERPIPVFQPGVVLVSDLPPGEMLQLVPVPVGDQRSRGRGRRGRGRAGRRGRGPGRTAGRGVARGRSAICDGVAEPPAIPDEPAEYDEAQAESDLDEDADGGLVESDSEKPVEDLVKRPCGN